MQGRKTGLLSDLKGLGTIGLFLLFFMNVMIVLGIIQIISVGWSKKIHCSVNSPTVNVTKWTDSDENHITKYSVSISLRVDNEVFDLSDYEITAKSLEELLLGTGDTNKQREVPVMITHILLPIPELVKNVSSGNYSCRSTFIGHAYQSCYVNYGSYYFSKPPDQDLAIVVMVLILIFADVLFFALYKFTKTAIIL